MQTNAASPRDLCYRIHQLCKGEFHVVGARPWNRLEPEESLWWLIPSTDWPAYKYAKLYFDWGSPDRLSLSFGLHVEKGLDPIVQPLSPSQKGRALIIRDDWAWHSFLSDLEQGTVAKRLRKAADAVAGENLTFKVEGVLVDKPDEFEPFERRSPGFRKAKAGYRFVCDNSFKSLALSEAADPAKLMVILKAAHSMAQAGAKLRALMSNGFLWIDVWLGFSLEIRKEGPVIEDAELWRKHLRHFAGWLETAGR